MNLLAQLAALEQSLHDPALRANPEAVAALLCDDFREFGASGRVWTRSEILKQLAGETPSPIASQDFVCQQLSPTIALPTYRAISPHRHSLRSSLWRCDGGTWRLIFHQGTTIPLPPGV